MAKSPSTSDAVSAVPTGQVHRPDGRRWRTLPPLPVVVGRVAPLVSGPPPVLPPLPGRRRVAGPPVAPAVGRVDGLTTVVPSTREPLERTVAPPPAPARPLVHRRGVLGPAAAPAAMVEATGSFVGEAREPSTPHRAPGWMRYVPEWLSQNTAADPEPAPVSRPKPPPPRPVERPAPTANQPRRPNLGQSRRLGLGAPLKHPPDVIPPGPVADDPVDSAEDEPPPAPPPLPQTPVTSPPTSPVASVRQQEPPVDRPVAVPLTYRAAPPRPAEPLGPRPLPTRLIPRPDELPAVRHEPAARPHERPAEPGAVAPGPATGEAPRRRARTVPAAGHPPTAHPSPKAAAAHVPAGRPHPSPVTGHVPPDLAAGLRVPRTVDVSSIPVHRGPEVSVEARALGARAFTRGGEVYLPAEAGPLDTPKARGLLAHELVHAVQQRTLGTTLPAPHTPAGQALEAEAVAAETAHADPAPLLHPSLTQVIGQVARTVGVQLAPVAAPPVPPPPPPPPTPAPPQQSTPDPTVAAEPAPVVGEEIDLLTESRAIRTLEEWTAPTPGEEPFTIPSIVDDPEGPPLGRSQQDRAMAEQILQVINVERAQTGEPVLNTLDANAMELIRRTIAERTEDAAARSVIFGQAVAAGGDQPDPVAQRAWPQSAERAETMSPPLSQPMSRQPAEQVESVVPQPVPVVVPPPEPAPVVAATDPGDQPIEIERLDLEQLTARLYDRLRNRIRMELLIDRERAGLLTDFR